MALICGGVFEPPAFADRCASFPNGPADDAAPKRWMRPACAARPRPERSRLMTTGRDALSKAETLTIAAIEDSIPALVEARSAVADFQDHDPEESRRQTRRLDQRAWTGLLASFVYGVVKDRAAVAAAITNIWSNGQTEGQITRLKLIKRQMYGRAKLTA